MRRLLFFPVLFTTLAAAADEHPGAALYRQKTCVTCHAADGSGSTPAGKAMKVRDLRDADVQKQSDGELAKTIGDGKGNMPGFGKTMSAEQIANVVSFIRTLKK